MSDPFAGAATYGRIQNFEAFFCEVATRLPVLHKEDVMIPPRHWAVRSIDGERVFAVDEEEFETCFFPVDGLEVVDEPGGSTVEETDDEG